MENLTIIAWVMAVFALLTSVSKFLTFVAAKTKNTKDDTYIGYFSKALEGLAKLIDYLTANTRPK